MNYILDNLAIGDFREAMHAPDEISAFLCVAEEHDITEPDRLYHKIPVIDMQPIPEEQMMEAVRWIRDQIPAHTVMVFCSAGVGRSPSVVIGYLYCIPGYGFGEAVEFVARKKPYMSTLPNLIRTVEGARQLLISEEGSSESP